MRTVDRNRDLLEHGLPNEEPCFALKAVLAVSDGPHVRLLTNIRVSPVNRGNESPDPCSRRIRFDTRSTLSTAAF